MQRIMISCTILTLEDFHIGTGIGNIGLYDDGQLKDNNHRPTIYASTLKGLLRDSCAALERTKKRLNLPQNPDLFAKIFQDFDNLSSLDIHVSPKQKTDAMVSDTVIHYFTAVEHTTRKTKNGSLRSMEFGAKGLEFDCQIQYLNRTNDSEQLSHFLIEGLKNIKAIGGHRRRGFGAIAITDLSVEIQDVLVGDPVQINGQQLLIIFELAEDTILSSKAQSGNMLCTNDYITGTTILGMLRSILLALNSQGSYLDDEKISSSFFYPIPKHLAHDGDLFIDICPAFISFRKRKDYLTKSSFEQDNALSQLPSWALNRVGDSKFSDLLSQNTLTNEDNHHEQGKGIYDGYLARYKHDTQWDNAVYFRVGKLYHQRNSINPHRQSTADSGIFIEENIPKGTCFLGTLSFATEEDGKIFMQEFQPWLTGTLPLHIGRGGKAIFVKDSLMLPKTTPPSVSIGDDKCFTLSLISDSIIYSESLQPCPTISAEILATILEEPFTPEDFQLLNYVSRHGVVSSFSGTSGLRRFRDIAIRKGSCFLFRYLGSNLTEIQNRLTLLQKNGIGYRKNEGFGNIAINHPLHGLKPSMPVNNRQPSLAQAMLPESEQLRLTEKAEMYRNAYNLADKLKNVIEGSLCSSMAADTLMKIESGMCLKKLKELFTAKMEDNASGSWGRQDSRRKIATLLIPLIDSGTSPEIIATALKLLLVQKGEKR